MRALLTVLILISAALTASAQQYVFAIRGGDPAHRALAAQMPEHIQVVDVTHWRDVPPAIRRINPAHYPALIDLESGAVVERPLSASAGLAKAEERRAEIAAARSANQRMNIAKLKAAIEDARNWQAAVAAIVDALEESQQADKE